jgi:serine/threonine protein kinase
MFTPTDESCGFDWHTRYRIIKEICQGLHYLHDKCITHLDLKPGNILVDEKMVPKLVDCGYSRFLSEAISQGGLRNSGGSL